MPSTSSDPMTYPGGSGVPSIVGGTATAGFGAAGVAGRGAGAPGAVEGGAEGAGEGAGVVGPCAPALPAITTSRKNDISPAAGRDHWKFVNITWRRLIKKTRTFASR